MGLSRIFDELEAPQGVGNYTYLLQCADGSLYAGWTKDLQKRLKAHNEGNGAKYTRARGPVRLVYYESFEDKILAMKREAALKKLTREQKERLIEQKQSKSCRRRAAAEEKNN